MQRVLATTVALVLMTIVFLSPCRATTLDPFGPFGEGGSTNGQAFTIGSGGEVFQLDAFLNIAGLDLNGAISGTSAQLSAVPLPAGLDYTFAAFLSADATDLTLTYEFFNRTGEILSDVSFFSFLDAEIDEPINSFFNEFGEVTGDSGSGATDANPDSWEIDEPGYVFGDIFDNLLSGMLDNTNAVPVALPDDVSMALGFRLGNLNPLDTAEIDILISEDGDSIGSLALVHGDIDPSSTTVITMSGQSAVTPVPEPSTLLLIGSGLVSLVCFRRKFKKQIRIHRIICNKWYES